MPKELFGQDLVNELALGLRIAAGEKGVQGGLNITVEKLFEQIKTYLSDSEVITPDNTTVWDEYEVYPAGNVFVSYTNISSPNPIFHDAAIYRSRVETPYGVSPEDDLYDIITNPTGKWEYQGQKVVVQEGGLSKVFFLNENEIQSVTGYIEGNNAVNLSDFKVYEYRANSSTGIKPNDNTGATGRWVEVGELGGGGGHTILDPVGNTMPTQPALQFGAGFTVTDEVDKTVVGIEYVQPISFAITDKFTFKPAYALSITSADVSSNITDLRVGKNGATPTTITYPYAVLATDILTFGISFTDAYNRELNSFITLIGQYL